MTIPEQVKMMLKDSQRKKKFKDVQEQDWVGAVAVISFLEKQLITRDNVAGLKNNASHTMHGVLSQKYGELMTIMGDMDMGIKENQELLETWLKNCVNFSNNLDQLKLSNDKKGKPDEEDQEPEDNNDDDYFSPEKFSQA